MKLDSSNTPVYWFCKEKLRGGGAPNWDTASGGYPYGAVTPTVRCLPIAGAARAPWPAAVLYANVQLPRTQVLL